MQYHNDKDQSRKSILFEELEPRLLFSADIDSYLNAGGFAASTLLKDTEIQADYLNDTNFSDLTDSSVIYESYELVIIDSGVEDSEKFVEDIINQDSGDRHFEVVVLDSNSDGVEQISKILENYQDIDAVHIISHGSEQNLLLGNNELNLSNINNYQEDLINWRNSLTSDADLLFYGCNLAESTEGQTLIRTMSALTGADVAASTDLTGYEQQGANWDLEYSWGDIESSIVVSEEFQESWEGTLAILDLDSLAEGTVVDNEFSISDGITISVENLDSGPNIATIFNSENTNSQNDNLESPWSGGNRVGELGGNLLIIAKNQIDNNADGLIDAPESAGASGQAAGKIYFNFDSSISSFGMDVIDVEGADDAVASYIKFVDNSGETPQSVTIYLSDFSNPASPYYDSTISWGSNTSNQISPINATDLGLAGIDQVVVELGGQMALNNINYNNTIPTSLNNTVTTNEDVAYTFSSEDFNFSDVDGEGLFKIKVTSIPGTGSLELNGIAVIQDQEIYQSDIVAGNLKFVPGSNENGPGYDSFEFKVHDGIEYSAAAFLMTIDVTAVNDVPENTVPDSQYIEQDTSLTFSVSDGNQIAISDIDANGNDVTVTLTVTDGVLNLEWPTLAGVAVGSEYLINTNTSSDIANVNGADEPARSIAMNDSGAHVVVWASKDQDGNNWGIFGQLYDENGNTVGSEFQVNTTTSAEQKFGSVAMDDNGNFIVVWTSNHQDGDRYGVYGQRFDASGTPQGSEFLVNTTTFNEQDNPKVAVDGDGNFTVVWVSKDNDGDNWGIFGQRYDASGVAQGGEFQVNTYTTKEQRLPDIAMAENGDFVVVWESHDQDGDKYGIYGQRFDSSGTKLGSEFIVNTTITDEQQQASIDMTDTGEFVVTWSSKFQDGDQYGIYAKVYDASGVAQTGEILVNQTTTDHQRYSSVAIDSNGNFTVTWSSDNQDGQGWGIYARQFNAAGTPITNEFLVNTTTSGEQQYSSIGMDAAGDFTIVWNGPGVGDSDGMFGRRYEVPHNLTFISGDGVNDSTMSFSGTIADINAALDGLTFSPNTGFTGSVTLTITTDDQGNTGAGGAKSDSDNVNIQVGNYAPTAANNTVSTNEDAPYTFTANDFNFSDIDGDSLVQIQITNLASNGSLELNGTAVTLNQVITKADIDAGLLKFTPAANANGSSYDSFEFKVHDGTAYSINAYTMTVDVISVNDLPTAINNTVVMNEDTTYTFNANDFNFSDIDGDSLAQIQITNLASNGNLELNGTAVTLNQVISKADIDAGLLKFVPVANANGVSYDSFQFKVHDGTAYSINAYTMMMDVMTVNDLPTAMNNTVVMNEDTTYTFNANDFNFSDIDGDSLVQIQIVGLDSAGSLELNGSAVTLNQIISKTNIDAGLLKFIPVANVNGVSYDSFEFKVHDGTAYSTNAYTMTMDVMAVNDAPTAANNMVSTNEDTPYTFTANDFNFSDIDGDSLVQIQITNLESNGSLELNGTAVTLNQVISKADIDAGLLKFIPVANANGVSYDNFGFKVYDGTDYSVNAYTMTMDVIAVNDAPTAANNTVSTNEDTPYTFTANDFNFSDIDGDSLAQIQITNLASNGSLELNGTSVTLNQVITKADIDAGLLTFVPAANANGSSYDSFEFKVHDGTAYSVNAYTMTMDVIAVNDAPTAANNTVSTNEDTPYTFTANDFNFSDIDGDSLAQIQITNLASNGSLELDGTAVSLNQVITKADIDAGLLKFIPEANANGVGYDSFEFKVHDGTVYSANAYTMTMDVIAVNDAPIAANNTVSTNEDTPYTFTANDFNFSDIDGDSLAQIQITNLASNGSLELNGTSVTLNQVITKADIDAGLLKFIPAANANGNSYDSFEFKVHDGTAYSVNAYTMTMDVMAVDDLPTAADNTVATNEDTPYTFSLSDFNFEDVDFGNNLVMIQITSLESAGSLELNNIPVVEDQIIFEADISAGNLKFTPQSNAYGDSYDVFGFKVHDGFGFSENSYEMMIDVVSVNDAPVAKDKTITLDENSEYVIKINDLNYSDIEDDDLVDIKITKLAAAGTLQLNGVPVFLNQVISAADVTSGKLKFVPDQNASGEHYALIEFKVSDGMDYSLSHNTITFNVNSVVSDQDVLNINDKVASDLDDQKDKEDKDEITDLDIYKVSKPESFIKNEYSYQKQSLGDETKPEIISNNEESSLEFYNAFKSLTESNEESKSVIDKINFQANGKDVDLSDMLMYYNNSNDESSNKYVDNVISTATSVKLTSATLSLLSASYVLRGGSIAAGFLSGMPMWKGFDPLPILTSNEKTKLKDGDKIDNIFEKSKDNKKNKT